MRKGAEAFRLSVSHWLPESPVSRRHPPAAAACCKTNACLHGWATAKNRNNSPAAGKDPHQEMMNGAHGLDLPRSATGEEEERARCEWDFRLCSVISPAADCREVRDVLGAVEFDPSDQLLATGGIARKIRIYSAGALLPPGGGEERGCAAYSDHASACSYYICTPAKLSSLRWRPDCGSRVVGAGDYDGVVTEYDLERRLAVFERDEHDGRRVWCLDYSSWMPPVGASGSDDGTAQLWDSRCGRDAARLYPAAGGETQPHRPAVCCVEFDPAESSLIGLGCADRKAYVYDLRMPSAPVTVFGGHRRTVTYLRFVGGGGGAVVSAGTDGCLRLWELPGAREVRAYEGHLNSRSFVGLSLWRAGALLGCGSETNELYVYDMRWGQPIWVGAFAAAAAGDDGGGDRGFVSSVCWRQTSEEDACAIVAAASDGELRVFGGRRKTAAVRID